MNQWMKANLTSAGQPFLIMILTERWLSTNYSFKSYQHPLAHWNPHSKEGKLQRGENADQGPRSQRQQRWSWEGSLAAWAHPPNHGGASSFRRPLSPSLFSCCAFHLGCPSTDLTSFYSSPETPSSPTGHREPFGGTPALGSLSDSDCRAAYCGRASQLEGKAYPE